MSYYRSSELKALNQIEYIQDSVFGSNFVDSVYCYDHLCSVCKYIVYDGYYTMTMNMTMNIILFNINIYNGVCNQNWTT